MVDSQNYDVKLIKITNYGIAFWEMIQNAESTVKNGIKAALAACWFEYKKIEGEHFSRFVIFLHLPSFVVDIELHLLLMFLVTWKKQNW